MKGLWVTTMSGLAILAAPASLMGQEGPGLFDINTGLSLWTVVVFISLLVVLRRYAWGPILGALEARERNIQGSIDEAARLQSEAASTLEQHRRQLGAARQEASRIIAESKEAATRLGRELEAKAREESAALVQRARREIEAERDAVLEAIRKETVGLALAAASRLVQQRLDAPEDRELVIDYLSSLSAAEREHDA